MKPTRPHVVVVAPHFPPAFRGGGPIRTLDAMLTGLTSEERAAVQVITSDRDSGATERLPGVVPNEWVRFSDTNVWYASVGTARKTLATAWRLRGLRCEVLYLNSVFNITFGLMPVVLARLKWWRVQKIVIAPRGEFDPGAMELKASKKRAYLRAIRLSRLHNRVVWHASSATEAKHIRRTMPKACAIVVKENETALPPRAARSQVPTSPPVRLVYLGRISPKKRLHILLEAAQTVQGVHIDVYGPSDDAAYLRVCRDMAIGCGTRVEFRGPVSPEKAREVFRDAHFACFPTSGENFGHVIAEALATGCPVMVADVTPWSSYIARGGGLLVPSLEVKDWREAIGSTVSMNASSLELTRATAAQAYNTWSAARDTTTMLRYLLTDGLAEIEWQPTLENTS